MDWCYSTSRGASDGILLLWDMRVVEKIKECGGFYCCLAPLDVEDSFSCALARVYGPNFDCDRRYFWEELAGLLSW